MLIGRVDCDACHTVVRPGRRDFEHRDSDSSKTASECAPIGHGGDSPLTHDVSSELTLILASRPNYPSRDRIDSTPAGEAVLPRCETERRTGRTAV